MDRRRSARQFRRGRDNRSRGMQSSRRRPGSAESGGAVSQDRASSRSSLRGRAGLAERASPTMGAGGGAGCASGESQVSASAVDRSRFRVRASMRRCRCCGRFCRAGDAVSTFGTDLTERKGRFRGCSASRSVDPVADAGGVLDDRWLPEFSSESCDCDFGGVAEWVDVLVPDLLEQLLGGESGGAGCE
jgi:hypothetical protein